MGNLTPGLDLCASKLNLCSIEAGCYNYNGSYICLCQDLKPEDPVRGCARIREFSTSNSTSTVSTRERSRIAKEGIFGHQQLAGMLWSGNRNSPGNGNETSNGHAQNSTLYFHRGTDTPYYIHTVLLVTVFSIITLVIFVLATYFWKQKRCNVWIARCLGRKHYDSDYTGSLFKCRQQYLSNPNHYSHSPDSPFLQMVRDIEISRDNLTLLEAIGEGCFGKVHKGIYAPASDIHIPVAIKIAKEESSTEAQYDFEREVEIISSFNHENILKLLGVMMTETDGIPWMVFEYMKYGDLAELLRANSPVFPIVTSEFTCVLQKSDLLKIATQISNGMMYLSLKHFIHRDLATRNCLVGENLVVKIADFGMTRDIYTCDYYKIGGSRMLPIRWMAPESITYGKFSLESDVWSFGVVLWEIYSYGKQPYYGHPNEEVVTLIQQGILLSPPKECCSSICGIMAGCWKTDPKDRLSFCEISKMLTDMLGHNYQQDIGVCEERYSDHQEEETRLLSSVPYASIVQV